MLKISAFDKLPLFTEKTGQFMKELELMSNGISLFNDDKKHLLICAAPKSASTFVEIVLTNIFRYHALTLTENMSLRHLGEILNFQGHQAFTGGSIARQSIFFPSLLKSVVLNTNTISRLHVIADSQTLWNIKKVPGFIPVITTRKIQDSLVSLRDDYCRNFQKLSDFDKFYNNEKRFAKFYGKAAIDRYLDSSFEEQMDFVIDHCAQWYFQFYLSWEEVKRRQILDVHFFSFESMIEDQLSAFANLCLSIDPNMDTQPVRSVLFTIESKKETKTFKTETRFNKGISGRGNDLLNDRQKARLERIGSYYGDDGLLEKYL